MPHYKITITDKTGKILQGIRYNENSDIDLIFQKLKHKAITTMKGNFQSIDVVMLSKYSPELLAYLERNKNNDNYLSLPDPSNGGINRKNKADNMTVSFIDRHKTT